MDALKQIAQGSIKEAAPEFAVGDTVRVDVKIREGDRERIQAFEGTVIAKKGSGVAEPLPFAGYPTASAWSVCSRCIHPMWRL